MDLRHFRHVEKPLVKTKIVATVGPACDSLEKLRALAVAGVDVFRLNFAHAERNWLNDVVRSIEQVSAELEQPLATLGDLGGPKIRLGELPGGEIDLSEGDRLEFVRSGAAERPDQLTSTYDRLIDDLNPGDRILLADGTMSMLVVEKPAGGQRIVCKVERPGILRSRQGINLPGVALSTPALTDKDRDDLAWAVEHKLDFVGLSFVRSADDVRLLRRAIEELAPERPPDIVAKIEKTEAISDLDAILEETDAIMIARGDLGVEVDVARVPALQKRIIRLCNQRGVPVITATQMLESMQRSPLPTRAEASDVANAVLDGSDALMLSGETAIGENPLEAVFMMSRIAQEAERLVQGNGQSPSNFRARSRAKVVTEAVTASARLAAEQLEADLIVVATHSGRTAMAVSKQRSRVPVLALTDRPAVSHRMCLYWGVTPVWTDVVHKEARWLIQFVVEWGKKHNVLSAGSRVVLVGSSNWAAEGHDLLLVHVVPK
jgi:pyruvate kinase